MNIIKKIIKWLLKSSPLDHVKKEPALFQIGDSVILLDSAKFDFRTLRADNKVCVTIGENSMVGCNFIFESVKGSIKIGKRTFINAGTNLISRSSIEIGDDVTVAWGCYIYDHDSHSLKWEERCKDIKQQINDYGNNKNFILNKDWNTVNTLPIKICDKVWIGFEAVILKGVTIGEGAVVGARAVVTKDVEPWTVVAGNPARVVKRLQPQENYAEGKT